MHEIFALHQSRGLSAVCSLRGAVGDVDEVADVDVLHAHAGTGGQHWEWTRSREKRRLAESRILQQVHMSGKNVNKAKGCVKLE